MNRAALPVVFLVAVACSERSVAPVAVDGTTAFVISDGAHGGGSGFYFLPPVAPATTYPGIFDASLIAQLSVRVCVLAAGTCAGDDIAVLTSASTPPLTLDAEAEAYGVVWRAPAPGEYRVRVYNAARQLGLVDVLVLPPGRAPASSASYDGFVTRAAVPVKFRVEQSTVQSIHLAPDATLMLVGQTRTFTATALDGNGAPVPGVNVSFIVSPSTMATLSAVVGVTNALGEISVTATGVADGSGNVIATAGSVFASALLDVNEPHLLLGVSTVAVPRTDACGNTAGRICESLVGNVISDAMRASYGVDFALMNAGGIRNALTCSGSALGFCPAFSPPPWQIVRGQVLSVLPFGTRVAVHTATGAEVKAMLEAGVGSLPLASGRFPQLSGMCLTYDISLPAGSRVLSVVRQAADGSCSGAAVDLTAAASYSVAQSDFTASGGDGYPVFTGRFQRRGFIDRVVGDFVMAAGTISPTIQGRIVCVPSGVSVCPVVSP